MVVAAGTVDPPLSTPLSSVVAGAEPVAFGIVCDEMDFTPPAHLRAVSFLARPDDVLDRDVLDVVIAYKMAGLDVALEVPGDHVFDAAAVLALASSLDVAVYLMPPPAGVTPTWLETVGSFTEAYCAARNFGRGLHPITDILALEMTRILGSGAANVVDNLDVWGRHSAEALSACADRVQERVVSGFEVHYGGRDAFVEFCREQFALVYSASRQIIEERVETYVRAPRAEA